MSSGKRIKDPVHGYISVRKEWVKPLVDTAYFQRLRNIRQLDTTRVVFPSADHSRFEHTLGVYELGRRAMYELQDKFDGIDAEEKESMRRTLECACLLHDIGHFPYSHLGEQFGEESDLDDRLEENGRDLRGRLEEARVIQKLEDAKKHEKMALIIILEEYGDDLEDLDIDPIEVCAFILGTSTQRLEKNHWEATAKLLSSTIDVDRLDYMLRDNYKSGASLVSLDVERLISSYTPIEGNLAFSDKALSSIRNYLDGRNSVYLWIINHHKVVCSNALLMDLINRYLNEEQSPFTPEKILQEYVDDAHILQKIREVALNRGESDPMRIQFERFQSRNYPNSCWKSIVDFEDKIQQGARNNLYSDMEYYQSEIEEAIVQELDAEDYEVLSGTTLSPQYDEVELEEVLLISNDELRRITDFNLYDTDSGGIYKKIPYIFVPNGSVEQTIEYINENNGVLTT